MQKIQFLPYIKQIAPQIGRSVWWCWSNTWSLSVLMIIWSSVQYVSKMKEIFLRNWNYSPSPVTLHFMTFYINWVRSQQLFSHSKCSAVPYYRRLIFETEILNSCIKPTVMHLRLHIRTTYFFHCAGCYVTSFWKFLIAFWNYWNE